MDKHDHARHLGECSVESVAWRTSASPGKGLVMVMMVHLYVALFMVRFRTLTSNQRCTPPSRSGITCTTPAPVMAIATRTDVFINWTCCTSICNPSSFMVSYCKYILILEEAKVEQIATVMRRRRLEWFGHVKRRDETENIRAVVEMKMEGQRPKGRPQLRWKNTVKRDMKAWSIKEEWATDREKWRSLCKTRYPAQGDGGERKERKVRTFQAIVDGSV